MFSNMGLQKTILIEKRVLLEFFYIVISGDIETDPTGLTSYLLVLHNTIGKNKKMTADNNNIEHELEWVQ